MTSRSASASGVAAASIARVFAGITAHDPTRFYPRYGVLPAVVEVRDQTGPWDVVGQRRQLLLSDRGTVIETITRVQAPDVFGYTLSSFTGVFGTLVERAESEWRLTSIDGGTRVVWTYTFTARRGRGVIVAAIMRFAWAPYMRKVVAPILDFAATARV